MKELEKIYLHLIQEKESILNNNQHNVDLALLCNQSDEILNNIIYMISQTELFEDSIKYFDYLILFGDIFSICYFKYNFKFSYRITNLITNFDYIGDNNSDYAKHTLLYIYNKIKESKGQYDFL